MAGPGRKTRRTFIFDYTKIAWEENSDNIPMLPVILSWGDRTLKTKMLVDTGANVSFILPWMARILHMQFEGDTSTAPGAGGQIGVRASQVKLRPAQADTKGRAARTWLMEHVLVPVEDDTIPFPILGRHPFFRWYDVEIREKDEKFLLKERRNRT